VQLNLLHHLSRSADTGFSEEQHKSVPMDEQVDLQRLEEFLLSSLNDYKILKNQRPHQTLNLNNYQIPQNSIPIPVSGE